MDFNLSEGEKKLLLETARETITAVLEKRDPIYKSPTDSLKENCGAFVTLHKKESLRGCIGYLTGIKPLFDTIKDMAVSSAFNDPRFHPVEQKEFSDIIIEISVLSPMEEIDSIEELIPGKHGLYLKKGHSSGTLLPQVAAEQGWDRETFVRYTCTKAGLPTDAYLDGETKMFIYSAVVFSELKNNLI